MSGEYESHDLPTLELHVPGSWERREQLFRLMYEHGPSCHSFVEDVLKTHRKAGWIASVFIMCPCIALYAAYSSTGGWRGVLEACAIFGLSVILLTLLRKKRTHTQMIEAIVKGAIDVEQKMRTESSDSVIRIDGNGLCDVTDTLVQTIPWPAVEHAYDCPEGLFFTTRYSESILISRDVAGDDFGRYRDTIEQYLHRFGRVPVEQLP